VIDGLADSDFGGTLPGTNLKGYTLMGNYMLSPGVWMSLRWMSATAIVGPPYKNDLLELDATVKF
jgi:Putative porin